MDIGIDKYPLEVYIKYTPRGYFCVRAYHNWDYRK